MHTASNERVKFTTAINGKIVDAMQRTYYQRTEKEKKIKEMLNSVEKSKAKKKFLINLRLQRMAMA
jgi:hypothetical protein